MKKFMVIIVAILLTSCAVGPLARPTETPTPAPTPTVTPVPNCLTQSSEMFLPELNKAMARWTDGLAVAQSTGRIALSGPVADLQEIRRDLNDVEAPECAAILKTLALANMDEQIAGFLLFMQDEYGFVIQGHIDKANGYLDEFNKRMQNMYSTGEPDL